MSELYPDEHVDTAPCQLNIADRVPDNIRSLNVHLDREMDDLEDVRSDQVISENVTGINASAYVFKNRHQVIDIFIIQFKTYGMATVKKIDTLEIAPDAFMEKWLIE